MSIMTEKKIDREPFAAYICDEMSSQILLPIIGEHGWSANMIFSGGIASAVRSLGAMPCPEFLIVDLSDSEDPRVDMQALADVCEEGTVVLALGTLNDVTLYRDLLHAGVHDYLVKPLTADVLRDAILTAEEAMTMPDEAPEAVNTGDGKKIVIAGVRSGLGTSTLATNIAWLYAHKNEPTVILDLDLYFGTTSMQFDLEPGRGLADALDNPARVDGLFLERAVVKPVKHLSILGAEAPMGSLQEPAPGALEQLTKALSENFRNVVVDVPRHTLGDHSDMLAAATDVVLVTDYSLTAARDCIRMIARIKQMAPETKIHLVSGKNGLQPPEVDEKDFENSVEYAVDVKIPYDPKTMMAATQKGKMVAEVAPTSKISGAYTDILKLFNPEEEEKTEKTSWFGKFLQK